MTFKKQIEEANAAKTAAAEAAEKEKAAKVAELNAIADKLEHYLAAQNPSEVGLQLERADARMTLKSDKYNHYRGGLYGIQRNGRGRVSSADRTRVAA